MGQMRTLTINGEKYDIVPVVPASSVTLLASAWVADGDKHSQVVEVSGVTAHTKVDLQPTAEQLEEFHYKVLAFVTENDGGKVTVYSIGDKPENDHTIQITKTEVEGVGKIRGNTVGTTMPKPDWNQTDPSKADYIHNKPALLGKATEAGGEIFNYYTEKVYTGDEPPKEYDGNTAAKGAFAQNFGTHADGEYSSASGWCSTASGGIANATGRETVASGYASTTEGWLTKATNSCAHAGGKETAATGANSFAHGLKVKATNSNAVATGEGAEASGYCANASGYMTKASGTCSSTFGRDTEAQQYASSAMGRGTIATARNQSVRGAYNIPDTVDSNGNGKYAEIVGGGTNANNRTNIYTLDWNGNAHFAGEITIGAEKERLVKESELANINAVTIGTYGFGATAIDGITANYPQYSYNIGWVYVPSKASPIGEAGVMRVETSQQNTFTHHTFYPEGDNKGYILRRYGKYNAFEPWEWVNPPMELGVEYRTTERFMGKPVYKQLVSIGELPNNSVAYAAIKTTELCNTQSFNVVSVQPIFEEIDTDGAVVRRFCGNIEGVSYVYAKQKVIGNVELFCKTNKDMTNYKGYAIISYAEL